MDKWNFLVEGFFLLLLLHVLKFSFLGMEITSVTEFSLKIRYWSMVYVDVQVPKTLKI